MHKKNVFKNMFQRCYDDTNIDIFSVKKAWPYTCMSYTYIYLF